MTVARKISTGLSATLTRTGNRALRILWLGLPFLVAPATHAQAIVTVDVAQPGVAVSSHLHGIFLEEINHAVDGGIYAELIRNRAFNESGATPTSWLGVGGAALNLDSSQHYGKLSRSLEMELPGGTTAGVTNGGFWGMNLSDGVNYTATVWAKASGGFAGPLSLTLESTSGTVLAQSTIDGISTDWQKFVRLLTVSNPKGSSTDNWILVTAPAQGTVWLQVVSLFPPTWKGTANGLRGDIASALADLHPKTMRFPGGAFVQGFDLVNSPWQWKTTIGDLTDRPGHPGLWGYYSSDGMGLQEYLQMAEDLGAEPVLCVFSGKDTGSDVVPSAGFNSVVQDALDAIEYANGDPQTTVWGAQRAANGHYAPFHLKYIEFGNEDNLGDPQGTYAAYRFPTFLTAVRAQYPDIKVISSSGAVPAGASPDLVDDHIYAPTSGMLQSATTYDSQSRSGPQVFVGEYASCDLADLSEPFRSNTLGGAIGEAGYMTGLERNSDLVWSSMYAPLLVNEANQTWTPDLIWLEPGQILLTPNYYVQQLFSTQIGDVTVPVTLTGAAGLLYVSATMDSANGTMYLKVVNGDPLSRDVLIALAGADSVTPVGAQVVLTSANRTDQNTFAAPGTVVPAATVLSDVGTSFSYNFPPNSITVITLTGLMTAPGPRNAFGQIDAESFDSAPSVTVEPCSEGGLDAASITQGATALFKSVEFGAGAVAMQARAISAGGASIAVWLDSANGTLAGTCVVPATSVWTTSSCPLIGVSGVHDLYLVFAGPLRLNWVQFLAAPVFTAASVTNGASFRVGIVPGSIASIFGAGLSTATGIVDAGAPLPAHLADASVTINGIAAPIFAVANVNGSEQINLQVPYEIDGQATATIQVSNGGIASQPVQVDVWPAQPGVFTFDGFTGAILHGITYDPVTPANPAQRGEIVLVYATGLGDVSNPPPTGMPADPVQTIAPVDVEIGGTPALVSYHGLAPGYVGLYQMNVTVPMNAPSGMAPLAVTTLGAVSQLTGLPVQ